MKTWSVYCVDISGKKDQSKIIQSIRSLLTVFKEEMEARKKSNSG